MYNCFNKNCQLCNNLVFSNSITVVTVNNVDTLVIDIPAGSYVNNQKICLVLTSNIPTTATIGMPVAISIGGDTTTVYPVVKKCNCEAVTACALRTRRKYPLKVATNATSAVFKSLGGLACQPNINLTTIPAEEA